MTDRTPRSTFAELLRTARLALDPSPTQAELAARLGRAQASVSAWESGKQIPGLPVLSDLAAALELDLGSLVDAAGDASRTPVSA